MLCIYLRISVYLNLKVLTSVCCCCSQILARVDLLPRHVVLQLSGEVQVFRGPDGVGPEVPGGGVGGQLKG